MNNTQVHIRKANTGSDWPTLVISISGPSEEPEVEYRWHIDTIIELDHDGHPHHVADTTSYSPTAPRDIVFEVAF